ncbi:MAG: transglycosylase domain-containing protein [Syntrophotaleaceae bacterium]
MNTLDSQSTSAPTTESEEAHFHQNIDREPALRYSTDRQPGDVAVKINLLGLATTKLKRRRRILLPSLLAIIAAGAIFYFETQTSILQAMLLSRYAAGLQSHVEEGESDSIVFPQNGPFDSRLGYARMPEMLATLKENGLIISRQARFSNSLRNYAQSGFYLPYREKSQAGLQILDAAQRPMYRMTNPRHVYADFDEIPTVIVESLLFIENRDLLSNRHPKVNPAVDWGRFFKAVAAQAGEQVHIDLPSMGGSTLATQIEKYRHSAYGITASPVEKLVQMASASVRAYRNGPDTSAYRKQLVLDYLNTVPLSAAPGAGEVNGLGDGLYVWFGSDFQEMNRLLHHGRDGKGDPISRKAALLKQVISLMIAHRRPSYYLVNGRTELDMLTNKHLRVLTQNGIILTGMSEAAQAQPLIFRNFKENAAIPKVTSDKGVDVVRNRLAPLLGISLYDLDRMDLTVTSTLNSELQTRVGQFLKSLRDPEVAAEKGIVGQYLLSVDQADDISYSFTLYERTPSGNKVRVQTDTTGLPFNINEGSKLELGSTAKLRTLATYLEIIAELHRKLSNQPATVLHQLQQQQPDSLTFWVCSQLLKNSNIPLRELLDAAMQRPYSANPGQRYFTGGGIHTFGNFKKEDNQRIVTVAEALQSSINLPFVRVMQDIVNYTRATQWENPQQVLFDDRDSRREAVLAKFIDKESKVFLSRFWNKYKDKTAEERLETLLAGMRLTPLRLTIVHRHLLPQADEAAFIGFIRSRIPTTGLSDKKLSAMYEKYRPGAYNLQDMGYLASLHPVELWLLDYLQQPGEKSLDDAIHQSEGVRREVYGWLMRTRAKNARDSRVRTVLEIDAFSDIHRRWKALGYPFDHLVPSLATALGSSGDRPAALAELIAIILNDGQRYPTHRVTRLEFAGNTPYETIVQHPPARPGQVMEPEVARVLKEVLGQVVSKGTAQRLGNTFLLEEGLPLPIGGKTGTGDNRIVASTSGGYRISSRALNRTATFVFYLGDHHFGTLTAFVTGTSSDDFSFTSALPLQVLKGMAPILLPEVGRAAQKATARAEGVADGEGEG